MWYVMQVISGKEGQTILMMEKTLSSGILEKCFVPMRRLKKKYHGEWREITENLFPGYVFLISGQPQLLYDELKRIPVLTKLLGSCEEYFTPLSESDVRLLEKLQDIQDVLQNTQNILLNTWNVQGAQNRDTWNEQSTQNGLQNTWNVQEEKNKEKYKNRKKARRDGLENIGTARTDWEQSRSGMPEVGLSKVVVGEDRQIRIISGPLKNLEGQIKKINLHKRIAEVETEFMGSRSLIHLGIEIADGEEYY